MYRVAMLSTGDRAYALDWDSMLVAARTLVQDASGAAGAYRLHRGTVVVAQVADMADDNPQYDGAATAAAQAA